jgi:hypothetical protein
LKRNQEKKKVEKIAMKERDIFHNGREVMNITKVKNQSIRKIRKDEMK